MVGQLTLVADLDGVTPDVSDLDIRPATIEDVDRLGALYFKSYDAGIAGKDLAEATDDIRASFQGEYGELVASATLVVMVARAVVGAVMTVHRAPWDDIPDCPFVIELFVDRAHRRRGMGRSLMEHAMAALRTAGEGCVGLRVEEGNEPGMALYTGLGFTEYLSSGG